MKDISYVKIILIIFLVAVAIVVMLSKNKRSSRKSEKHNGRADNNRIGLPNKKDSEINRCVKVISSSVKRYYDAYFAYYLSSCIRQQKLHTSIMQNVTGKANMITTYPKFEIFDDCEKSDISTSVMYESIEKYLQENLIKINNSDNVVSELESYIRKTAEEDVDNKLKEYSINNLTQ